MRVQGRVSRMLVVEGVVLGEDDGELAEGRVA